MIRASDVYVFLKEMDDKGKEYFFDYIILKYCGESPPFSVFLDISLIETTLDRAEAVEDLEEFRDIIDLFKYIRG